MDLLHLVDRLEELVAGAQKMPIGNRAILDRRRMLDLIDQMRIAVPHEVREAQDIVAQRDAIRREAEEEGRLIIARAEERAAELVEEHPISEAARRRAEEIAVEAERRLELQIEAANEDIRGRIQESRRIAREQMDAADEYARELLLRLERQLAAFQSSIRQGVQQLEPQAPSLRDTLPPMDDRDDLLADGPAFREASLSGGSRPGAPYPGASYPGNEGDAPEASTEDDEFEDLLHGRPARSAPEEAPPGVIDDFEHEALDDDPLLGQPWDSGRREEDR